MKTKPFAHQTECYDLIKNLSYYALFAEPGLGKTKIALDCITYNKEKEERDDYTALVVCPNTIVENWADEVMKHSDLSWTLIQGSPAAKKKKILGEENVHIINYEGTRRLWKELRARMYDYIVFDESTYIKNPKAAQSKACLNIVDTHPRPKVLIMSGTPIMNSPLDIFAQYRVLDGSIFGHNFYRFRNRYAVMGGYMNKQAIQWKNMHDFRARVFSCAIRKTKDECLDLPEKLYQVVNVDLSTQQREVYKKLKEQFIYEFKDIVVTAPVILTRLMRFSQITAGFTKDVDGIEHDFNENPKVNWLLDFLDSLEADRKVVVFCRFRNEIRMVESALRKARIKYVSVHGGTDDRLACIKTFNNEPSTRVFIGQLQTAGIGINLTSAHYCVFLSNSYSYGDRVQCEDRTHRIGQHNNVTYIDVLARGTVDAAIHSVLKKKQSLANMVVGDIVKMI